MAQRFETYDDDGIGAEMEHPGAPDASIDAELDGDVEAIGNHMTGDSHSYNAGKAKVVILSNYVTLRQLANDAFVPLKISEAQAKGFLRRRFDSDGQEELLGDINRVQLRCIKLLGHHNGLPLDVAPVSVLANGTILKAPKSNARGVFLADNGHTYARQLDANTSLAAYLKAAKPAVLYENTKMLPKDIVNKWKGVSVAELDKGVTPIAGTDDSLLDLEVNQFYPESLHAHQHLLEQDFPEFEYVGIYEESNRRKKDKKVRIPTRVLEHLKFVMKEKGIDVLAEATTPLPGVGVKLCNPKGKNGSFSNVQGLLAEAGVNQADIGDALDAVRKVSVTVEVTAIVH